MSDETTSSLPYRQLVWHVAIQWLASKDLLDEWTSRTANYIEERSSFGDNLPKYSPPIIVHTFPFEGVYEDMVNWKTDWVKVKREWREFYFKHNELFIQIIEGTHEEN